jgi:hypothetical protein
VEQEANARLKPYQCLSRLVFARKIEFWKLEHVIGSGVHISSQSSPFVQQAACAKKLHQRPAFASIIHGLLCSLFHPSK